MKKIVVLDNIIMDNEIARILAEDLNEIRDATVNEISEYELYHNKE